MYSRNLSGIPAKRRQGSKCPDTLTGLVLQLKSGFASSAEPLAFPANPGAGKAVTTVRVAINEQGRDKAVFIDLQSWEKTAEFIASYGTKGRLFEATARLALDQWKDAEGSQHSKHYLVTGPYQFRFLDKSSDLDEPEAPAEDV